MKLSETGVGVREDGTVYTTWIPSSMNGNSRTVELGRLPLDGWERMEREEVGSYPSGTAAWQYYKNASGAVIRRQEGSGYVFGQITEVVKR